MVMANFDRYHAAFIIACYIKDLPNWSDECLEQNVADARQFADDLGVRMEMEQELWQFGSPFAVEVR